MKKYLKFYAVGILFGVVLSKAEVISWYRIQEMFRFESFHMYGVIGSAVLCGMAGVILFKRNKIKTYYGEMMDFQDKVKSYYRYILGGSIFGLGWALTGGCPGPLYILLGHGYFSYAIVIVSAIAGTFVYGLVRHKLPH